MIRDSSKITKSMGDVPRFKQFSSVMNPITTEYIIGKGVKDLSADQIEILRDIIGSRLNDLGYEL